MSYSGFTIPGMTSCGCGGGSGSCACSSSGTKAGGHEPGGSASMSASASTKIPGFPSWAESSACHCGGACDNCKKRTHGAQPKHQGPTKHAVVSRGHTSGATPSGFRENGGGSKIGVGIPTAGHRNLPERSLSPLRGVSARNNTHEGVPVGINDPPPAALPQETAWKPGPCHGDWIQIPGTNIWVCTGTQEWIASGTGKRGYGVGTIDSGHSTSESPRQKNCTVELWMADLPKIGFLACHLWVEVHHCDGSWDRWEVWQTRNTADPSLGHIRHNAALSGQPNGDLTSPEMIGREVISCDTPAAARCECISDKLVRQYRWRDDYLLFPGPNSNTFAVRLLRQCGLQGLAAKYPACAWGATYGDTANRGFFRDPPLLLPEIWRNPASRLYPVGPR